MRSQQLTEPYRRELQVHCYRMLGSLQDAEDTLQDTLLAAWQGFEGFEGRSSLRTWLYRIATNRCLNARRSASRRPAKEWDVPGVEPPEPTRLGEVVWLEPFPDALLEGARRRSARSGGPLRAGRSDLPRVRDPAARRPCRPGRSLFWSCATSSDSTRTRWLTCSIRLLHGLDSVSNVHVRSSRRRWSPPQATRTLASCSGFSGGGSDRGQSSSGAWGICQS